MIVGHVLAAQMVHVLRSQDHELVEAFRARVVDATTESFVFEMTGSTDKLDAFVDVLRPLGLVEVSRTGVAAIARGTRVISAAK